MNEIKSSWSFVEISPEAREAAERAANAAGMDLDAWLAQLIKYTSAMELKTVKGNEPAPPAKVAPVPAPPARPLTVAPPLPPIPAAPAPLGFNVAPGRPADTLVTGHVSTDRAAERAPERGADRAHERGAERAEAGAPPAERATVPTFTLPSVPPRPTVTTPQRPGGPALGLRPAPTEPLRPLMAPPAAIAAAVAATDTAPAPGPRPALKTTRSERIESTPRLPDPAHPPAPVAGAPAPAALAAPASAAPTPAGPETPRMVATDMLQPSRFAALASPKEDDIQAALDKWRASGMLEPLIARPRGGGQFEIISGIDRWHAARRAYVRQIPVLVRAVGDQEALEQGLIDQLRRAPVSPLAEANIYLRLLNDAGLDTERAARLAGKPASHVATMVRILNLPKSIRGMLEKGEITIMHARALLDAPNPEAIARDIIEKRLDIYQTEQLVRVAGRDAEMVDASILMDAPSDESIEEMGTAPFAREPRPPPATPVAPTMLRATGETPAEPRAEEPKPAPPSARRPSESRTPRESDVISTDLLERNIANALGVRCAISERNGVGVITLHYTSREELVRILARINGGGTGN